MIINWTYKSFGDATAALDVDFQYQLSLVICPRRSIRPVVPRECSIIKIFLWCERSCNTALFSISPCRCIMIYAKMNKNTVSRKHNTFCSFQPQHLWEYQGENGTRKFYPTNSANSFFFGNIPSIAFAILFYSE